MSSNGLNRFGVLIAAMTLLFTRTASAHEKWFYQGASQPTCWCALAGWRPIIAVGVVVVLTVLGAIAWRYRGGRDLLPGPRQLGATHAGRAIFYGLVPLLLAIHLSVPLLVGGMSGKLFSPNNEAIGGWRYLFSLCQIACALAFFYGACTRAAAVVLALAWTTGLAVIGWEPMFENLHYLGFAAFFYFTGRGPWAVDRWLFPKLEPPAALVPWGMLCLRISIGLSLAFVAFTEKLANPALAVSFLQQHPMNFTAYLHIPLCDASFALICGAVELLVGLWIALGLFPRPLILIAFIPFNLTLSIFHWSELAGHLPFYGALAVLLFWTPDAEDRALWVKGISLPSPAWAGSAA